MALFCNVLLLGNYCHHRVIIIIIIVIVITVIIIISLCYFCQFNYHMLLSSL